MTEVSLAEFDRHRVEVRTSTGPASCIDTGGSGPAVLFVHGLATSSYLWRHVVGQLAPERRCVAVDLPLHGRTPAAPGQDFSLNGLSRFVADCCDALGLDELDVVANDTGGAVAQIFACKNTGRLRTLTLTDCEAHGNVPPWPLVPAVLLARAGLAAPMLSRLLGDLPRARKRMYGSGYQDVGLVSDELVRAWLDPLIGTRDRAREFQRMLRSIRAADLLAVEPALARLEVPTLVVWGTDDGFFPRKWAYWLRDTIPGAVGVVEIDGGRLFLPDERAGELTDALRRHLDRVDGVAPQDGQDRGARPGG